MQPTSTTASPQGHGLRAHIIALVAAALLPALAVGGIAVAAAVGSYRQAFEDRLEGTAGALASAVNTEIGSYVVALSTLATARGLDPGGDLPSFHQRAQQVAAMLGTRIFVVTPDLSLLLHTHFPVGTTFPEEPRRGSVDVARQVFKTGQPAVGNLLQGRVTGRTVAPIYVPVIRDGQVVYAIGIAVESERLSRMLAEQSFGEDGYATVVDGQGQIMARSKEPDRFIAQTVRDWVTSGMHGNEAGILRGTNRSEVEVITAFRRVASAPGWSVMVVEPLSAYHASLWPALTALMLGGLASLAIALGMAVTIARRIMWPVLWLTQKAERVAATDGAAEIMPDPRPVRVQEFVRLREAVLRAHLALRARTAAVAAAEARLRAIVDTAVDAIVVFDDEGTIQSLNRAAETIFGYEANETVGWNVSMLLAAEDDATQNAFLDRNRRTGEGNAVDVGREVEGRRKDGSLVPIDLAIAEWRDGGGQRYFTAIMRDISARRADEARKTLLMREVDHRAKNILAVVQSVLRLTSRDEPRAFATAVEARVAALARAHSLLAEGGWYGADLRAVAERALSPHAPTPSGGTVRLHGPPVPLASAAVQPLAMVLHELATNAAKYGALSVPGGTIALTWRTTKDGGGSRLHLQWTEADGVPIPRTPTRRGFGTRLIEATVRGQLGGDVIRLWRPTGLVCEISIPLARAVTDSRRGRA